MPVELSSRERVLAALDYREIDRPPAFFRADPELAANLRKQLGLSKNLDLLRHFGSDSVQVEPVYRRELFGRADGPGRFYDMFGNLWLRTGSEGAWTNRVERPVLAGASGPDDLGRVRWPGPEILDLEAGVRAAADARAAGLAVYGGVWSSIFTNARFMLGEEEFLVALVDRPELAAELVRRLTDCFLELNRVYLESCAGYLDIYYFGSDFGTQDSTFISPVTFREVFKPQLGRIAAQARSYGLRVMYHTCGAVSGLVEDLIKIGVEVLDPVQVSAAGMAPAELGRRFRGRIAFHGGISTQTLLPSASTEEVYAVTRATINELGPLGYIVAPDQDMIGEVPLANVEALFRAVREYLL